MMHKRKSAARHLLAAAALAVMLAGCAGGKQKDAAGQQNGGSFDKVELTVSAAASLTEALQEVGKRYGEKQPNVKLAFNFGASGALQQQIEQGAPADLFIAAAAGNMRKLVDKGLVDAGQQSVLLRNELVLIAPATPDGKSGLGGLTDLAGPDVLHIAVGQPETVPAGSYAKEALSKAGLWDTLQSKLVLCKDVRQVLTFVESGNAEAGFVYKTDARGSTKTRIVLQVDPAAHKPIDYPAGIVKATKHGKEAGDFYEFLRGKEAGEIFMKFGFTVPG